MVKGPSELHPVFTVSLGGVAIDHEKVKGAVACVQDFVRHPLFTQRSFFSETGISMLNTAVTAADAVRNSDRFDPWGAIGVEAGLIIADLKSCRKKILSQRKAVKDTRERWFSAETVASSAVGESAPEQLSTSLMLLRWGTCRMWRSMRSLVSLVVVGQVPGKARRGNRQCVLVSQKKQFSVSSPSVSRPSLEFALEKSFEKSGARRSGRNRRNAPVFQGGHQ